MEIISKNINKTLQQANNYLLAGSVCGPTRMILGIVQAVVNLIAAVFFALGSLCFHIESYSPYHPCTFFKDAKIGLLHVTRGFLEMLPFSVICLDCVMTEHDEPVEKYLVDSHPYHSEIVAYHSFTPMTTTSIAKTCFVKESED